MEHLAMLVRGFLEHNHIRKCAFSYSSCLNQETTFTDISFTFWPFLCGLVHETTFCACIDSDKALTNNMGMTTVSLHYQHIYYFPLNL